MTLPNYEVRTKVYGGTRKNLRAMARHWIASSICGWFPSAGNAHSLVLLGGTGSGKSSIAQSGLVAFSDALSQFGYSLSYAGPVDKVVYDYYHDQHYREWRMPDATEEGARYTLTLNLSPTNRADKPIDVVFTDIAGEKMEASLLGGAEDPVVLGALRSAKTFVYLFDFVAWKSFAATLASEALRGDWSDFVQQKQRLENSSRAVRDSFEMLKDVVNRIYQLRSEEEAGASELQAKACDFILVFPKADMFWEEGKFLEPFFEELKRRKIVLQSLASKHRFASRGVPNELIEEVLGDSAEKRITTPEHILSVGKWISELAKQSLLQGFARAFGDSESMEAASLPSTLERGVIELLESRFDNVYILPISALGLEVPPNLATDASPDGTTQPGTGSTEATGNVGARLDSPPAQVLCEFVFLIAAASAMRHARRDNARMPDKVSPVGSHHEQDVGIAASDSTPNGQPRSPR